MSAKSVLNEFRGGINRSALREVDGSVRIKARSLPVWGESIPRKIGELYTDSLFLSYSFLVIRPRASSEFGEVWDGLLRLAQLYLRLLAIRVHQKTQH